MLQHRRVLNTCCIGLVALGIGFAFTACGGSSASQDELDRARQQGAAQTRQQLKIQRIEEQLKNLKHGRGTRVTSAGSTVPVPSGSAPAPAPSSGFVEGSCGGSLSVGPNTTCEFAQNVENDYYAEIGSGAGSVDSYSPAKDRYYSMYCTAGSPHECTGGNNASVFFP